MQIGVRPGAQLTDVCFGVGYGKFVSDAVQTVEIIIGVPTSGGFELTIDGLNTASIPFNSTAAAVETIVSALTNFGDGELSVSGGNLPSEVLFFGFHGVFGGQAQGNMSVALITMNNGAVVAIATAVNGGLHEVYLVVIQHGGAGSGVLWAVTNPNNDAFTTTTWTQVATGLNASDWEFDQLGDKIYGVNSTDGIAYYQLGGGWSAPAGISGVQNPVQSMSAAPQITYPAGLPLFGVGSVSSFSGAFNTNNPTVTFPTSSRSSMLMTLTAPITQQAAGVVVALGGAGSPYNFSKQDYWMVQIAGATEGISQVGGVPQPGGSAPISILSGSIALTLITSGGSPITVYPDLQDAGEAAATGSSGFIGRGFYFGELTEAERASIVQIQVTFTVAAASTGSVIAVTFFPLDVWMNDTMASINILSGPTRAPISYAYSYLQASTGLETKMSPITQTVPAPPPVNPGLFAGTNGFAGGCCVQLIAPVCAQLTGTDVIIFYRFDQFGVPRRISIQPNGAGSNFIVDALMADELTGLTPYGLIHLPGGYQPTQIGDWKGCLVVASGGLAFISGPGVYNIFAPDPAQFGALDAFDPTNPDNPRTVYMSANRADPVLGIVGQDSLYLTGAKGAYVMTNGGLPNQLTPPLPMPDFRGALGFRSTCKRSGGELVASQAGLYYYSAPYFFDGSNQSGLPVDEEETKEVRGSWSAFVNAGFPSNGSATIVSVWNDEIWCMNTFAYLHRSRSGHWESGTFQHAMKGAISDPSNGLICATSQGALVKIGGAVPLGSAIPWSWTSGIMDGPRQKMTHFLCFYTGTPQIQVTYYDGNSARVATQLFDLADGKVYVPVRCPFALLQGWRWQVTISSKTGADTVSRLEPEIAELAGGKAN